MSTTTEKKPKTKRRVSKKAAPVSTVKEAKIPQPKKKKTVPEESVARIRIKVSAYEHKLLDSSIKQILDTALRHGASVRGPVPLPTEIKKYTVNRATFVYKDAREQFEMRIHKRLIDIINPTPPLIEALTNLTLPSGVSIDVKML